MIRTRVGYCGGTKNDPTYYALGDHSESVAIDFDPEIVSFEDLLDRFWAAHHCGTNVGMRQYMNVVFFHNDSQKQVIEKSLAKAAGRRGIRPEEIRTAILPAGPFTYAEDYHQKYSLTYFPKVRAFLEDVYPDSKSLADSTVATRLNAFLGSGWEKDLAALEEEIPGYGLPGGIQRAVLAEARKRIR